MIKRIFLDICCDLNEIFRWNRLFVIGDSWQCILKCVDCRRKNRCSYPDFVEWRRFWRVSILVIFSTRVHTMAWWVTTESSHFVVGDYARPRSGCACRPGAAKFCPLLTTGKMTSFPQLSLFRVSQIASKIHVNIKVGAMVVRERVLKIHLLLWTLFH